MFRLEPQKHCKSAALLATTRRLKSQTQEFLLAHQQLYDHNNHTMKTKITNQASQQEKPFPKLMIDGSGDVYLMTSKTVGTIIHSNAQQNIGQYGVNWIYKFEDFSGEVTLSND